MRITVLAAFIAFALSAQQQPVTQNNALPSADELNRELPHWVRFSGEYRTRVEGFTGGGYRDANNDTWLLSRIPINMKVQPLSWLKFQFQGQDARVFWKNQIPAAPPY